jgi:hypothetical protein
LAQLLQNVAVMFIIDEFKEASFEEKCDWVVRQSDYLAMRWLADCKVLLYHSNRFFIEVYFSTTYKRVLMINAFQDSQYLMPYVDEISLADLLKPA